jgi:hypothetical protein
MPLTDDRGLVSILAQHLREGLLGSVEVGISIPGHAVSMPVFSGKNRRPTWTAECIGYETFPEKHSFTRQLVDMGGMGYFFKPSTVSAN